MDKDKKAKNKPEKTITKKALYLTCIGGDRLTRATAGRAGLIPTADPFFLPLVFNQGKIKEFTSFHLVTMGAVVDVKDIFTPVKGPNNGERIGDAVKVIGMTAKFNTEITADLPPSVFTLLGLVDKSSGVLRLSPADVINDALAFQNRKSMSSTITTWHEFGCVGKSQTPVVTPTPGSLNEALSSSPGDYIFTLKRTFKEPIQVHFDKASNVAIKNAFYSTMAINATGSDPLNYIEGVFTFYYIDV